MNCVILMGRVSSRLPGEAHAVPSLTPLLDSARSVLEGLGAGLCPEDFVP